MLCKITDNGWVFLLAGIIITGFCKYHKKTTSENLDDVDFNSANRNILLAAAKIRDKLYHLLWKLSFSLFFEIPYCFQVFYTLLIQT